ncbi:hypothetical protein DENSPDRAFT_142306 [Dentipellis sp. KUC8613]|nr:hypothetical protein DENSPDRAFT_142306 [Dentipellis sp. KUC8613]
MSEDIIKHGGDFLAAQGDRMKTSDRCFPDLTYPRHDLSPKSYQRRKITASLCHCRRQSPRHPGFWSRSTKERATLPLFEIAGTQHLRVNFRCERIQASRSFEGLRHNPPVHPLVPRLVEPPLEQSRRRHQEPPPDLCRPGDSRHRTFRHLRARMKTNAGLVKRAFFQVSDHRRFPSARE